MTCAAPSDLGANDCRRLKAARALCTAAFALVLVCAGATAANCYAHVADAPGRVRVFVDFVAALSGNLSSASALGTLYCASAIGARASNERDWSRQNHALRRSTYVVVGHVAVESLIAVLASRSVKALCSFTKDVEAAKAETLALAAQNTRAATEEAAKAARVARSMKRVAKGEPE